jgi:hypothetical protein
VNIGKKVAVLAATAGALVLGSAGGASAHGGGYGGFDPFGTIQTNSCDTASSLITAVGGAAPTGDITNASNCLNFTNGTAAVQSNDCDTAAGPITAAGAVAPTGAIAVGSNCTNIAYGNP